MHGNECVKCCQCELNYFTRTFARSAKRFTDKVKLDFKNKPNSDKAVLLNFVSNCKLLLFLWSCQAGVVRVLLDQNLHRCL